MICWNLGVQMQMEWPASKLKTEWWELIHEVGHNFWIVNSDERQWTWMDESLNSFMEFMAEQN
jgi:hypothetical protein